MRASSLLAVGSDTVTGTAERRGAPRAGGVQVTARQAEATDRDNPAGEAEITARETGVQAHAEVRDVRERQYYRPLWIEEPARRRRLPDPVRTAAVRAVILIALTLIQAMVAFLCTMAGSWLAFPMVISSVVSTIVATWGALDVWVTRQVWNQRNGVVSMPSSTARALRRERRRARRQARTAERAQERIRRRGGAGQLSHS
ncbi:hypothetical protein [Streptomyces coeruleorubidus]|uniref:Uncharacterized protein n=1 Tax=Streptomyces coeruleorubidus TaxID=116188 RepID=A0A5J6I0E4_STRC4|nr:hypothetical protein [Streptomyces coeruleorubidus]QEV24090.1 hypothetical protein CP976_07975 [Streptomyces coeruleorubidus]GGU07683.1 hypothetical protein GCM10010256_79570 [Streptomyces coeruleorubidus]